jgi:hypothetical protein
MPFPAPPTVSEVIVTAPAAARADARPGRRFSADDIAGFGEGSVGDLLDALAPQLGRAGRPSRFTVDGRQAPDINELRDLPAEAVSSISVSPQLDGGVVIAVALKRQFSAVAADASERLATAGGRREQTAAVGGLRIQQGERIQLTLHETTADSLRAADRGLVDPVDAGGLDPSGQRALLPASHGLRLGAALTDGEAGGLERHAALRLETAETVSDDGPVLGETGETAPGRTTHRQATADLHADATWPRGPTIWQLTGGWKHEIENQADRVSGQALAVSASTIRSDRLTLDLMAARDLWRLPAGPAAAVTDLSAGLDRAHAMSAISGAPSDEVFRRRTVQLGGRVDAPLTRAAQGGWTASSEASVDRTTAAPLALALRYAVRGQLASWLGLGITRTQRETPPALAQTTAPETEVRNALVFDGVTGETAAVTRIGGGTAGLRSERQVGWTVALDGRLPRWRFVTFSAVYSSEFVRDPIRPLEVVTPDYEAAFPTRYRRNALGALTVFDARPVNLAGQATQRLNLQVAAAGAWTPPGRFALGQPVAVAVALADSVRLEDRLRLAEASAWVDGALGEAANPDAAPHHLEAQLNVAQGGRGLRLDADWLSAHRTVDPLQANGALRTASRLKVNLRVFAQLPSIGRGAGGEDASGPLISLAINNLFASRIVIRDARGLTPFAYRSAQLDPLGRTLEIKLHKSFQ